MRNFKKICGFILLCVSLLFTMNNAVVAETTGFAEDMSLFKRTEGLTPIMGTTSVSVSQMINYFESNAAYPQFYSGSDAPNIYAFCQIYIEECATEGVRAEVAFAQAMKETGYLRYGGDVKINQYNFAGLGATGGGNCGNSFSSVRQGVRAQVQHLKAYATKDALVNEKVDPRYQYVNKGSAPYVEWLGKYENPSGVGWATAYRYGYSIRDDYMNKLFNSSAYSTWYAGTDYTSVYNPDYYMSHNPDVAKAFGTDSDTLIKHFLNQGMNEGRRACEEFDVTTYMNRYSDLRAAFGDDKKQYYYHYMFHGKAEGRNAIPGDVSVYNGVDYSTVYDYQFYMDKNPDIKAAFGDSDLAALEHFVRYGMSEGRVANASFNVNAYMHNNKDLRAAFGKNKKLYYEHYMNYGKNEGRDAVNDRQVTDGVTTYNGVDYSSVYNYQYYITRYPDIAAAFPNDDIAALEHFVLYGINEGRQAKDTFSITAYIDNNKDLRAAFGKDKMSYVNHYINYGKNEGRNAVDDYGIADGVTVYNGVDYAQVYDYQYYISKNPDIAAAFPNDDIGALEHFVLYGQKEGRQAKDNFNPYVYQEKYEDLRNAFGSDLEAYYTHYRLYGYQEGRTGV